MAALRDPFLAFILGANALGAFCLQRIASNTLDQIAQSRMAIVLNLPIRQAQRELSLIQRICGGLALVCASLPFLADFGQRGSVSNAVVPLTLGLIIAAVGIGWQAWVCWRTRRGMQPHDVRRQFTITSVTLVSTQLFGYLLICGAIAYQWRAIVDVK